MLKTGTGFSHAGGARFVSSRQQAVAANGSK
jgi:hypothetical protein